MKDRIRKWLVTDSPVWVRDILYRHWPKWWLEWAIYYDMKGQIRQELAKEVANQLVDRKKK